LADSRAESTAGNSQDEYSSAVVCGTTSRVAPSFRTAMLTLASHVSIARTIIYEQFYHTSVLRWFHFERFGIRKNGHNVGDREAGFLHHIFAIAIEMPN
jgi:hypothetical protein